MYDAWPENASSAGRYVYDAWLENAVIKNIMVYGDVHAGTHQFKNTPGVYMKSSREVSFLYE